MSQTKNHFFKKALQTTLIFAFSVSLMLAVSIVAGKFPSRGVAAFADGVAVWDGSIATNFAGGTGTETDPYKISNGAQLAYLAKLVNDGNTTYNAGNKYYKLTNDIYLNDTSNWKNWGSNASGIKKWTPIGTAFNNDGVDDFSKAFYAKFDGSGYVVKGIYINTTEMVQGLFGCIYGGAAKNIGIEQSYVKGDFLIGSLVGFIDGGSIINCYNSGIVAGEGFAGGVAGSVNIGSSIINCYNTGNITGQGGIGGVVGQVCSCTVTNCYNIGNIMVASSNTFVGGVTGIVSNGNIINCYNTGGVTGSNSLVGGVAGYADGGIIANCYNVGIILNTGTDMDSSSSVGGIAGSAVNGSIIMSCYNTSSITGSKYAGGIVGYIYSSGSIKNCYNSGIVTGGNWVGGLAGSANGSITSCYNIGKVTGSGGIYIGGITGCVEFGGVVMNCYNTGSIVGGDNVGGITGVAEYGGVVRNCYNAGDISGGDVGGIAGFVIGGVVINCYNTGAVTGGGVAGYFGAGVITYCYCLIGTTASVIEDGEKGSYILEFDKNGNFSGNAINSVTIGSNNYFTLLTALNAWVDNQAPGIYARWLGTAYPIFILDDNGTGGETGKNETDPGGCGSVTIGGDMGSGMILFGLVLPILATLAFKRKKIERNI